MKRLLILIALILSLTLTACSKSVSTETFESIAAELEQVKEENSSLKESVASLERSVEQIESRYEKIDEYIAESEAAEEESRALENEIDTWLEQYENEQYTPHDKSEYVSNISYNQINRNPDEHYGKLLKYSGKVLQVIDGDYTYADIRLAIDGSYDKVIYCSYKKDIVDYRVLQDDWITVYGKSNGIYTYESTGAGPISVPWISVQIIEQ